MTTKNNPPVSVLKYISVFLVAYPGGGARRYHFCTIQIWHTLIKLKQKRNVPLLSPSCRTSYRHQEAPSLFLSPLNQLTAFCRFPLYHYYFAILWNEHTHLLLLLALMVKGRSRHGGGGGCVIRALIFNTR